MTARPGPLAGEGTLLACWRTLARTPFGPGRLVRVDDAVAAVFPQSAYFNNAILTGPLGSAEAAAASVAEVYDRAGVSTWALWLPSDALGFDRALDRRNALGSLVRDVTTVVMRRDLDTGLKADDRVTTTSHTVLRRLVEEEPVLARDLDDPPPEAGVLTGWALIEDGQAVTSAYSFRHGSDCGVYAVGTLPEWRRRGLAQALVEHVLADAWRTGARTATLQSTPMGRSVYAALGFEAVGRYEEWVAVSPSDHMHAVSPAGFEPAKPA